MYEAKLRKAEIIFFVFYFFILQFFSDLQYYLEFRDNLLDTILFRLMSTPFVMLAYLFYYKRQIPLLLGKNYPRFLLTVLLFIGFLEMYLHLLDWVDWHNPVLGGSSREFAKQRWQHPHFPRQSLWLTFTNLFAITGLGYFIRRWKEERIMHEMKQQHLELELNYLKAQLHPHFFFNTLNNIYSLALYRSERTAPTVAQLSQLMRYIIYEGNKARVPLRQEIEFLKNYTGLEKIRHEENLPISFICQGNSKDILVPPLLFMPLMENGFKHGFTDPLKPSWLEAVMLIEDKEIIFEVKNSKHVPTGIHDSGIGLQNLQKRLLLLYPGRHILHLDENDHRFEVSLTIQLS